MIVTLNRDALKVAIRQAILNKMKEREGAFTHTNRDGYYSPSRWWYDQYNTALGGYVLRTSGELEVNQVNDRIVLGVILNYEKETR